MTTTARQDIARITLGVIFIAALILTSAWILRPFLPATIWATMIVVSTWPLMLQCQERLWGKRGLAVTVMTAALLLVFVIPFSLAIGTIVDNTDQIAHWAADSIVSPGAIYDYPNTETSFWYCGQHPNNTTGMGWFYHSLVTSTKEVNCVATCGGEALYSDPPTLAAMEQAIEDRCKPHH